MNMGFGITIRSINALLPSLYYMPFVLADERHVFFYSGLGCFVPQKVTLVLNALHMVVAKSLYKILFLYTENADSTVFSVI